MVRIVHIMRGRLRLRLDAVKHRPGVAARLHEYLITVPGILNVEVKIRTGSVLLNYDPSALASAVFLDDLSTAMGRMFPDQFAPGRARIRVDLFKGRPQLSHRVQQQLAGVVGIHQLEIDPSDGTCLLVYDSRTVTSPGFIDAMTRHLAELLPQLDVKKILSRVSMAKS